MRAEQLRIELVGELQRSDRRAVRIRQASRAASQLDGDARTFLGCSPAHLETDLAGDGAGVLAAHAHHVDERAGVAPGAELLEVLAVAPGESVLDVLAPAPRSGSPASTHTSAPPRGGALELELLELRLELAGARRSRRAAGSRAPGRRAVAGR
jgi:hypothetical protein